MVDNTILNLGVGGDTIASEDRGCVKYQKALIETNDSGSIDAFGRLRISNHETIFDSSLLNGSNDPLFCENKQVSGTSTSPTTVTADKPYTDLASDTAYLHLFNDAGVLIDSGSSFLVAEDT